MTFVRAAAGSNRASGAARRSPLAWLGALLVIYLGVPIVAFLLRLAGSHDRGFGESGLWAAARTSAVAATVSMAIVVVLGVPLAHWLARSRSTLTRVVSVLVQLPLALPPVMSGIVLIYLVGPYTWLGSVTGGRLTESTAGVVIAQTFVAAPFLVISARSSFESIDPALDDLAATLGHRPLARFWRVDLRVAARGIRAGALMTWLRALGEYGATVLLAYHPYTLPVFTYVQFSSSGIPTTQAPTALALGAAAILLLLAGFRVPARLRRRPAAVTLPPARHPAESHPEPVGFDIDTRVGEFRLQATHHADSHRIAVLGASGAGKSLLLRGLAGLLGPDVGTVTYGGADVSTVPVERRRLGYVPQNHGLFPDRTAWQQTTFGIHADPGVASWWLDTLGIARFADRRPEQLSGGQRQRVRLAAALAGQPRLVLLDEPFSALDTPVRQELAAELRRLQRDSGLSTVLVTHDPQEAALLADEILVLADGRIVQSGSVAEVFGAPATPQVARMLGIANVLPAQVTDGGIDAGGVHITVGGMRPAAGAATWCVRPEDVRFVANGGYPARVLDVADVGSHLAVDVALGSLRLRANVLRAGACDIPDVGVEGRIDIDPAAVTVWHQEPAPGQ